MVRCVDNNLIVKKLLTFSCGVNSGPLPTPIIKPPALEPCRQILSFADLVGSGGTISSPTVRSNTSPYFCLLCRRIHQDYYISIKPGGCLTIHTRGPKRIVGEVCLPQHPRGGRQKRRKYKQLIPPHQELIALALPTNCSVWNNRRSFAKVSKAWPGEVTEKK